MEKKIIYTDNAPAPIGPYSQAVKVGNHLFISGQIAFEISQKGEVVAETHQVMKQIGAILEAANMSFENVVKCSIFLKHMSEFTIVNEVYASYFGDEPPARETVEVSKLPKNVNVEISAIAIN